MFIRKSIGGFVKTDKRTNGGLDKLVFITWQCGYQLLLGWDPGTWVQAIQRPEPPNNRTPGSSRLLTTEKAAKLWAVFKKIMGSQHQRAYDNMEVFHLISMLAPRQKDKIGAVSHFLCPVSGMRA